MSDVCPRDAAWPLICVPTGPFRRVSPCSPPPHQNEDGALLEPDIQNIYLDQWLQVRRTNPGNAVLRGRSRWGWDEGLRRVMRRA